MLTCLRDVSLAAALIVTTAAWAQEAADINTESTVVGEHWRLEESDRIFLIAQQADTLAPMTYRVGTLDQLQTVQGLGTGFYADAYADFAPVSWLQLGATLNYGTLGDPAVQNILAPTFYVKTQWLRQASAGVNLAGAVSVKKLGFGRPTDAHPNDGELEAQLLMDKRIGRVSLTANAIVGKSFSVPDSDAELKLSAGYYVFRTLLVGLDSITRYDTSFDGGPRDGTRYWEFTGGAVASWKISNLIVSALAGVAAPMHAPVAGGHGLGIGPTGMLQLGYLM